MIQVKGTQAVIAAAVLFDTGSGANLLVENSIARIAYPEYDLRKGIPENDFRFREPTFPVRNTSEDPIHTVESTFIGKQ